MNTYYISDFHAYHKNIIMYCNRKFTDVDSMNRFIIESHNSVVTSEDKVIFGGDFAFAAFSVQQEFFKCLNAKEIICIKGNHDRSAKTLLKIGFKEVYDKYEDDKVIVRHKPEDFTTAELASRKYCLYGHVHDKFYEKATPYMFNICVEPLNYIPRTLEQLKELYGK